ncbi:Phox homologous domain-containing protein [Phascolomyces articulosus]|uniref:Phox homologous domain-containing protein n=1 Tax=Phascolomyces articulosus TaxID=60185 RepID=A0AAD5KAZ3_9FUNG|nr:Phox homologous domain-containing protein [Phascolomyces articulosus]
MDYQKRLTELLELCQEAWVNLRQQQQYLSNTTLQHSAQDLHLGIKQLVQLQDALDDNDSNSDDPEWRMHADNIMDNVRERLQYAMSDRACSNNCEPAPTNVQSSASTPIMATSSSTSTFGTTPSLLSGERHSSSASSTSSIINTSIPEEHGDMDEDEYEENSKLQRTFGRRSIIVEDWKLPPSPPPSTSSTRRIPKLFKGLKSTRSTPLPGTSQISLFNCDDNNERRELFASDAIVNHPLRIGVGYGSYICYNCTVLSDKGPPISVRKRYSDFVDLRDELVKRYPRLKTSIPKLPPKKVVGKFTPSFVEQRRRDLEYFFKYVVLHPTIGNSATITHWIAP